MDNPEKPLTVLSLCTGYGGIERGLELAGVKIRVVAHVEIQAYAIANLVSKMEEGKMAPAPIWTNLKTLNAEPFRDRIDLITGGYPCQPFSTSGQRKGKADSRHLWPYINGIISKCRPRICFFENVQGHLSKGFSDVVCDLGKLDYYVTAGIFSALEVGSPQPRKRVYIMAISKSERDERKTRRILKEDGGSIDGMLRESKVPSSIWPARYTKKQREWEEPRISRRYEPGLGRTINGVASWVDRISLLGNGVVPQTAALAWKTLSDNFK